MRTRLCKAVELFLGTPTSRILNYIRAQGKKCPRKYNLKCTAQDIKTENV
jgi:hypothetical protein